MQQDVNIQVILYKSIKQMSCFSYIFIFYFYLKWQKKKEKEKNQGTSNLGSRLSCMCPGPALTTTFYFFARCMYFLKVQQQ